MADTSSQSSSISITTGNEINGTGKLIAGILFILITILNIGLLIAYWPNKLPRGEAPAIYKNKIFQINLIDSSNESESSIKKNSVIFSRADSIRIDSIAKSLLDSSMSKNANQTDSIKQQRRKSDSITIATTLFHYPKSTTGSNSTEEIIGLNTLLMLLVALAGFLGTMIHIATSFTNYVGSEKFKRSWLLWYIVKPFIGAALALVLYFVFRAGLLNFNDTSNINLYGIITMAAFAGLFTDKATMKLAEIFEVLFKTATDPKTGKNDERPDKLKSDEVNLKIIGIQPKNLLANIDNQLIISGEGFEKKKLTIKIDDDEIQNPVIKGDSIALTYKIPDASEKNEFMLTIFDDQGKQIYSTKLIKGEINAAPQTADKINDAKSNSLDKDSQSTSPDSSADPNPEEINNETTTNDTDTKG